jgi:tetratricopeptide (TPR) repeat protein
MPDVNDDKVPRKAREMFNKGFAAFERDNLDYAIDMLAACVEIDPKFHQARKFLHAAEIKQFRQKKGGALTHLMNTAMYFPVYVTGMGMLKAGKFSEALATAERLLRKDPLNLQFVTLFTRAACGVGMPEAGIQTLEMIRECLPAGPSLLKQLGALYRQVGRTADARECFEKLCELTPNDPDAVRCLKDALAMDSMVGDGWKTAEKGGTFRDMIKDKKEAATLEQESKAVKSEKDATSLIEEMKAKVAAEPGNLNYYRALSRLYAQARQFEEAIEVMRKAVEIGRGDPQLENLLSSLQLQKYDSEIEQLKAAGDTAAAEARETERIEFEFNDLQDRVQRYPNDLELRYEWGVLLYRHDKLNEAIQHLQLAQRNPNVRHRALFYMGLCFKEKRQFDMALDQLKKAANEIPFMDEIKKDVCYEIGLILEGQGDSAAAAEYYKMIYQADISYRDIAERMEKFYNAKGQ